MIILLGTCGVETCSTWLNESFETTIIDLKDFTKKYILEWTTKNWDKKVCLLNVPFELVFLLNARPFISVIFIDAPLCEEKLIDLFSHYKHGTEEYIKLLKISTVFIFDVHILSFKIQYYSKVEELLFGKQRPSWDSYFIQMCHLVSKRSNCMKKKVGCVVVSNNRIISTGYNGTPQNLDNCYQGGCKRCNGGDTSGKNLDLCLCLHAEENAIMEAGKSKIVYPSILYCTLFPCVGCCKKIVQMGFSTIVFDNDYNFDMKEICMDMFKQANIKVKQI